MIIEAPIPRFIARVVGHGIPDIPKEIVSFIELIKPHKEGEVWTEFDKIGVRHSVANREQAQPRMPNSTFFYPADVVVDGKTLKGGKDIIPWPSTPESGQLITIERNTHDFGTNTRLILFLASDKMFPCAWHWNYSSDVPDEMDPFEHLALPSGAYLATHTCAEEGFQSGEIVSRIAAIVDEKLKKTTQNFLDGLGELIKNTPPNSGYERIFGCSYSYKK